MHNRELVLVLVAFVGIVVAIVLWTGSALASPPPPVLRFGPPATWPDVECRRATLRDETRKPTRVLIIEICYQTRPVVGLPGKPGGICTLWRPCPL